jgi:hypothetical protein
MFVSCLQANRDNLSSGGARQSARYAAASAAAMLPASPPALALASAAEKRISLPSSHIRCMITASLRATATTARLWPRLAAIRSPHDLTLHHGLLYGSSLFGCTVRRHAGQISVRLRGGLCGVDLLPVRRGLLFEMRPLQRIYFPLVLGFPFAGRHQMEHVLSMMGLLTAVQFHLQAEHFRRQIGAIWHTRHGWPKGTSRN